MRQFAAGWGFVPDITRDLATLSQIPQVEYDRDRNLHSPQWRIQGPYPPQTVDSFSPRSIPITDWRMELTKKAWIGTSTPKRIWFMEGLCPQTSYQVSVFCKIAIFSISVWKYGLYVNVGESMLLNEVVYLRCLFQIYAPTFSIMTLSAKKASASGDCVLETPTKFYTSFTFYR